MENNEHQTKKRTIRVGGILKEVITIRDETGAILSKVIQPLKLEFYARDFFQVVVGSMILAIPIGFTEEVWILSEVLPRDNIIGIFVMSLVFLSMFVYYNLYRGHLLQNKFNFLKRTLSIYLVSFLVVGMFLTVIAKAPWFSD